MKMIDLFCGTKSVANIFENAGHDVFTIDFDSQFNPSICGDILNITSEQIINDFGYPDVIWASPPCTTFSPMSCQFHWDSDGKPKTDACLNGIKILEKTVELIEELSPRFWFLENPRGKMRTRKILNKYDWVTVTYCQYGERYMKPTDIWGKFPSIKWRPMCKNGDSCHESAPSGSYENGIQSMRNPIEKAIIPKELCIDILNACEDSIKNNYKNLNNYNEW